MALDQTFNADTLSDLRAAVLRVATKAGMSVERATDVMLVVHELAANAVRYGGGRGVVQVCTDPGELHCEVSDTGPSAGGNPGSGAAQPWPLIPGHGLWLVHKVADYVSVARSRGGSRVTAVFALRPAGATS